MLDSVDHAGVRVKASTDNVAGVRLPRFETQEDASIGKSDLTGAAWRVFARGAPAPSTQP